MENKITFGVLEQMQKIQKELLIGLIVLLVAGIDYTIYSHLQDKKEYTASTEYFLLTQTWKNKEKPIENLKEETQRSALEKYIENYKNTSSALSAAILLAEYYTAENNNEKALEVLNKNTASVGRSFVDSLYTYRKAIGLEKVGQCEVAIQELNHLINHKKAAFIVADARLQKALCLEQTGKKEEAKTEYENISKNFGNTEAGKNAKKYLRLLGVGA